jgi:hypothetical protein
MHKEDGVELLACSCEVTTHIPFRIDHNSFTFWCHEVRGMCEPMNKESLNLRWGFSDRIMGNLLLPQAACDGALFTNLQNL